MNNRIILFGLVSLITLCLSPNSFVCAALQSPISAESFGELLSKIVAGVASIIAGASVIMFVIAGILFLTSAGSPERLQSAKNCLKYALVGLFIALIAGAVVETMKGIFGIGGGDDYQSDVDTL